MEKQIFSFLDKTGLAILWRKIKYYFSNSTIDGGTWN